MTMLDPLGPDLWTATSMMRFPGGVRLPIRMTVVRLPDGGITVISPLPVNDALASAVAALGPVRTLVGPSLLHHLSLGDWRQRFPDATLLGTPGLAEKRRDLAFDGTTEGAPWGDALTAHLVAGAPRLNEVVFHHPASRTLITTDLVFNILEPANRRTSLVLRLMGTRGRLARSREWGLLTRDRGAQRDSVDRMLALPFDRVLMAHGEPVEGNGRGELARALSRA
jgi:hypothetical protein